MMPVMGVALIIVTTGIERGIFGDPTGFLANQMQTATLFLIFTSCFVSPFFFKRSMGSHLYKKIRKYKNKTIFLSSSSLRRMFLRLTIKPIE